MKEIILMKNNSLESISIINSISNLNPISRIYKITTDITEVLAVIKNYHINIIIIDYELFKHINVIDILQLSSKIDNIIVLINDNDTDIVENQNYIFCKTQYIQDILKNILLDNEIRSNNDSINIKTKISQELKFLGYNFSYYGTKYLIECIYYLYTHDSIHSELSMKSIYKILAKKYNKTENNIKCNITRATSIALCDCEEEKLKNYLGICLLPKSGSKVIIQTVLNKLGKYT